MPEGDKRLQFIFDHITDPAKAEDYGYLGLMYEFFIQLAKIRTEKRIGQKDLAKMTGMKQSAIARIEAGRTNPSLRQLIRIARALDCRIKLEPSTFVFDKYPDHTDLE